MDIILTMGIIFLSLFLISWEFRFPIYIESPRYVLPEFSSGSSSLISSGELPSNVFGVEMAEIVKKYGSKIITENYLCIGERKQDGFVPSKFLLDTLASEKCEMKRIITNAKFNENGGYVEHPGRYHYRITKRGVIYHTHDKERFPSYYVSSLYRKFMFERQFENNWKKSDELNKKIILKELNNGNNIFLVIVDGSTPKYDYAKNEEKEEFKSKMLKGNN